MFVNEEKDIHPLITFYFHGFECNEQWLFELTNTYFKIIKAKTKTN